MVSEGEQCVSKPPADKATAAVEDVLRKFRLVRFFSMVCMIFFKLKIVKKIFEYQGLGNNKAYFLWILNKLLFALSLRTLALLQKLAEGSIPGGNDADYTKTPFYPHFSTILPWL
jgi:hypothetical protein